MQYIIMIKEKITYHETHEVINLLKVNQLIKEIKILLVKLKGDSNNSFLNCVNKFIWLIIMKNHLVIVPWKH